MKRQTTISVAIIGALLMVACGGDSTEDGAPRFEAVYKVMTFPVAGPELRIDRVEYETPHRWRMDVLDDETNPMNEGAWQVYEHPKYTYSIGGRTQTQESEGGEVVFPGDVWAPLVIAPYELGGEDWVRNGDVYESRTSYQLDCPEFESLECRGGVQSVEQRELEIRNADGILLEYREYADDRLIRFTTIAELKYD